MKKLILVALLIGLAGLGALKLALAAPSGPTYQPIVMAATKTPQPLSAAQIADYVNLERDKLGIARLSDDPRLDKAAQAHCDDMIAANVYSHYMPDGKGPVDYILPYYGTNSTFTEGENNSYGYTTNQGVVQGWMGSPGHKANIVNQNFTLEGIATCKGTNYTAPRITVPSSAVNATLVVQIFTTTPVYP